MNKMHLMHVINSLKYLEKAPTFFAIDHLLSLRIKMNFLVVEAMLFRASKVTPQVKAASPAIATTWFDSPARSRAAHIPSAADRAVPACPAPNESCMLSSLVRKPL